jgi:hypothetical protein
MMQRPLTITHLSENVTRHVPVANHKTKLLTYTAPDGVTTDIPNPFQLVTKLFDGAGVQIPANSFLYIAKKSRGGDWEDYASKVLYAPYFDTTESDQRNAKFLQNTFHPLANYDLIRLTEGDRLEVYVDSPVAVDLNRPETRLELKALFTN